MEYYSAIKPLTVTWIDLEILIQLEVKDKCHITYMWNPKKRYK